MRKTAPIRSPESSPAPDRKENSIHGATVARPARTILLFTRAPAAEARAKRLPVEAGSRLFAAFLQGWRRRAAEAGAELRIVAPHSSVAPLRRLLPGIPVTVQEGNAFASRVEAAFVFAFSRGAASVLMVSGDGPPPGSGDINAAFQHLESHDRALVLVPAEDGGVNAIGFTKAAERPLAGLAWRSSGLCRQLEAAANGAGLALLVTSPGLDLDGARDAGRLYRLSLRDPQWKSFRWLLRALIAVARETSEFRDQMAGRLAGRSHLSRGPPRLTLLGQI